MHHIHALIVDLTLITIYAGITTLICKKAETADCAGICRGGNSGGSVF